MEKLKLKRAAIIALMSVFTVAICFIVLGAISVELMATLGISSGQFGTLVLGFFLTSCIVQLFIGPLVDSVGFKPVAILGFVVTGLSLLLLAFSTTFTMAFLACILMGVGAMSLNTVGNTLIPVVLFDGKDPARASNFGNGFFGLGYILTPLLIVFMFNSLNMSYNSALMVLSLLMLVFLAFALMASFPRLSIGFKFNTAFKLLYEPAVLVAALALFCYISLEVSMGTWIRSLMDELNAGSTAAGATLGTGVVLSLFGVAMMAGRFLFASVKNLTAMGSKVIIVAALVSLAAILLMVTAGSPAVGIVAVILAGLAFAPLFPTIIGVTFSKFDPSLYGSIFGIVFAFGLLGGTFVPNIIGNLSVEATVQQSLMIAGIMAGILVIVSLFIGRVGKKNVTEIQTSPAEPVKPVEPVL
jgi:fucose permease